MVPRNCGLRDPTNYIPRGRPIDRDPPTNSAEQGYVGRHGVVSPARDEAEKPRAWRKSGYNHEDVSPLSSREVETYQNGYFDRKPSGKAGFSRQMTVREKPRAQNHTMVPGVLAWRESRRANTLTEGNTNTVNRSNAIRRRPEARADRAESGMETRRYEDDTVEYRYGIVRHRGHSSNFAGCNVKIWERL